MLDRKLTLEYKLARVTSFREVYDATWHRYWEASQRLDDMLDAYQDERGYAARCKHPAQRFLDRLGREHGHAAEALYDARSRDVRIP